MYFDQLQYIFNIKQFSLSKDEKKETLISLFQDLHQHHVENSLEYKKIYEIIFKRQSINDYSNIPYIPVSMFKTNVLKSIKDEEIFKVLTSSGTTGSIPSRIFLDQQTAQMQTIALSKIITHIIGNTRLPMMIVDSKSIISDPASYSARGAGILGFSVFGKDQTYFLDDSYNIDTDALNKFKTKYDGQPMLIFGFTFMIWQYLYQSGITMDMRNAILIHSGGWKKLQNISVDNEKFKLGLDSKFGLKKIYNFYGMIEQIGSIFIENSDGYLHCPNFSDIIIRNPIDLSIQPVGKEGLIQVLSVLPWSYPGHSILTEDIGVCMGEDNASNGWKGKYFKIIGRAKKAELRGCSDTFVYKQ